MLFGIEKLYVEYALSPNSLRKCYVVNTYVKNTIKKSNHNSFLTTYNWSKYVSINNLKVMLNNIRYKLT